MKFEADRHTIKINNREKIVKVEYQKEIFLSKLAVWEKLQMQTRSNGTQSHILPLVLEFFEPRTLLFQQYKPTPKAAKDKFVMPIL